MTLLESCDASKELSPMENVVLGDAVGENIDTSDVSTPCNNVGLGKSSNRHCHNLLILFLMWI